jgi:dTDP-4-amino-4,6-dideoxy-D-galactose acyltransferase
MNELCRYLPWDSNFFGLRIAQVDSSRLDPIFVSHINQWCIQNEIDCLYFLADPDYKNSIRIAEGHQFHLVDVRITWHQKYDPTQEAHKPPSSILIRPYQQSDLQDLRNIARRSFTSSRFYSDPCFPREKCDDLYDLWIKNSCEGYADHVIVAINNGSPQGFITCHVHQNRHEGNIGLIGVGEQARGQGVGYLLTEAALKWFINQGINHTYVVTQGGNIPAHRLYGHSGFSIHLLQLWYHKWFKGCAQNNQ